MVSFVVAMNRVDVVDLVADLVDVDLDVDLVDVDLAVSLYDGPRLVLLSFGLVAPTCFIDIWPRLVFPALAPTCFSDFGPDLFFQLWPRLVLTTGCFSSFLVVKHYSPKALVIRT